MSRKPCPADLAKFVETLCEGRQYDSCKNSPCSHSGSAGCTHPQHPYNLSPTEYTAKYNSEE